MIFDRTAKKLSKGSSPKPTPNTSPRKPKSAPASYQTTDHATQEQKVWTLTNTLKSTPLMSVPRVDDSPSTEVWTVNEIPELKIPESSLSPHPSTSKESLQPTASDELTRAFSMVIDSTSSSTESCKRPVAPRNEVVITVDDDDEIIYTSEKFQHEDLSMVKDFDKETSREEVVIRMEPGDGKDESLMMSESQASSGELIHMGENLGMNNVTTDDAIIDIMTSDDENEGPLATNHDGKSRINSKRFKYCLCIKKTACGKGFHAISGPPMTVQYNCLLNL